MHCAYEACKSGNYNCEGYCHGLVDFKLLKTRHDELVAEMKLRGYKHDDSKIIENINLDCSIIDAEHNMNELLFRCKHCRSLMQIDNFINKH